ncbi:alpha/beta fold hydrolase [Massilia sp. YIM B02769]|uniref:alpha/beta hydrolase n=1 Tax=unclassified Massilia TaxID=2609279 RepID=UPI0025B659C6|nr:MULTISPECIES: alpha/beta fold hydrolase [unclassified Massilia]MDN4056607.1 alpha/beta fold hydrolase [Massilia sp. YIM B02769]
MNKFSKKFYLTGLAGKMECLLDLPEDAPRGIALVAHPHPLYGGTMENKVTQTLARTFVSLGYATARFNFRGVGESEGEHDRGHGEVDDMQVMLNHMREQYPGLPVALSGFSFGTFVQAQLHARLAAEGNEGDKAIERMVLVGTAAGKWPMPAVPEDTILIHGEQDDTITLQMVFDWARPLEIPVVVIPGADHFFHRRLNPIKNIVTQMWRRDI